MRSAFRQLVRTRHHKGLSRRSRRGINLFDGPTFEPMRPRIGDRSEISERTEAIRRYLTSQINRPFDEVYQEVCAYDGVSQPPREVIEAVTNMVHRNTTIVDGEVRRSNGGGLFRDFYVHPEDGTLQSANSASVPQPRTKRRPRTKFLQVNLDAKRRYVQISGTWFLVTFGEIDQEQFNAARIRADKAKQPLIFDWVFRTELPRDFDAARVRLEREWGAPIYAVEKRQIAKREVRRVNQLLATQLN